MQGVREICDRYGILLIADEVMSGFGRTGAWWAVDHWGVVPDLITMAKGLTASYLPLGAVGMRRKIADDVPRQGLLRRPDLQLAPDGLRRGAGHDRGVRGGRADRSRAPDGRHDGAPPRALYDAHPSVGATRNIGLFGIVELVKTRARRTSRWRRTTARPTR